MRSTLPATRRGPIDLLVTALTNTALVTPATDREKAILSLGRDDLGELLWQKNRLSVEYRYTERCTLRAYSWTVVPELAVTHPAPLHLVTLDKQRQCYEYQTCEHTTWRSSDAHTLARLLEAATAAALTTWPRIPARRRPLDTEYLGAEEAPWEWRRADGFPAPLPRAQ